VVIRKIAVNPSPGLTAKSTQKSCATTTPSDRLEMPKKDIRSLGKQSRKKILQPIIIRSDSGKSLVALYKNAKAFLTLEGDQSLRQLCL
jgi:hypothetical protein